MEVLAQWSEDLPYPRRNADYAAVSCTGMDATSKMNVGGPLQGSKSVHFNEDNNSDSV